MAVCSISCWALILGAAVVLGTAETGAEIHPKGPRDCGDVLLRGDLTEGYYAVYPNVSNPDEAGLVYCGIEDGMSSRNNSAPRSDPRNCRDLLDAGMVTSGINVIYPYSKNPETPVVVYCEQELLDGGWTVFQRRQEMDTQLDFYKSFDEYSLGFGNTGAEFWLGNDIIHELTSQSVNELYVDLTNFNGVNKYARYSSFYVAQRNYEPSIKPYQLSVGMYSGTAGDAMIGNSGIGFSAYNDDNDDWDDHFCARDHNKGGWWYADSQHNLCGNSHPNGVYGSGETGDSAIHWYYFNPNAYDEALQTVRLMTRPLVQQ